MVKKSFMIYSEPMSPDYNVVAASVNSQMSEPPILYFISNICTLTHFWRSAICDVTKGSDSSLKCIKQNILLGTCSIFRGGNKLEETTEYRFEQEGKLVSILTGGCKQRAVYAAF